MALILIILENKVLISQYYQGIQVVYLHYTNKLRYLVTGSKFACIQADTYGKTNNPCDTVLL